MEPLELQPLLEVHKGNIALIIGNGINRYNASTATNSWPDLLKVLSEEYLPGENPEIPAGLTLTEFYDLLELRTAQSPSSGKLQKRFCDLMSGWQPFDHHKQIVNWAKRNNTPILTTNFEEVLCVAGNCTLMRMGEGKFTDFYPWQSYYSDAPLTTPTDGFGIWHINGMQFYRRSIRLGLTHYMGSVQRARDLIYTRKGVSLYSSKPDQLWEGANSWLHIIFNKPLLIFGLGLEENEVFLRWLLIERARYFDHFKDRRQPAWFAEVPPREEAPTDGQQPCPRCSKRGVGKLYFLKGVGVESISVGSYDELYGPGTWE